jgi:hypothetical protein
VTGLLEERPASGRFRWWAQAALRASFATAAITLLLGCGRIPGPLPSPTPFTIPSPQFGQSHCPAAPGQTDLLSRLAKGGVRITSAAASTMQPIFKTSAVVCFMQTPQATFEAAFFSDSASAVALRVCVTQSGSRFMYGINGQTLDSASPLYWTVVGTVIVWTSDALLNADFTRILGANAPIC